MENKLCFSKSTFFLFLAKLLFFVSLGFSILTGVQAKEIYQGRDADGNLIFSDTPFNKGKKIHLDEIDTVPALPTPRSHNKKSVASSTPAKSKLQISITAPVNESAFYSEGNNVDIAVSVIPAPRAGYSVVYFLDGKEVASLSKTTHTLQGVDRGTHSLQVAVRNLDGKEISRSSPIFFTMLQHSVIQRQRAGHAP